MNNDDLHITLQGPEPEDIDDHLLWGFVALGVVGLVAGMILLFAVMRLIAGWLT